MATTPHIDNAVGKGGRNDKHDVAVIQTALAAIKGRDGRPLR